MDQHPTAASAPVGIPPGGSSGSATRLLVLGCVRIFQPVHGYFLRRELISWRADEWARVHPGSIYNALRSLTRADLLEALSAESAGVRPARTSYRLTAAGELEFLSLLRQGLSGADDSTVFLTAVNLAVAMPRAEVLAAVTLHAAALEAQLAGAEELIAETLASPEVPDHASEVLRIIAARTAGELTWTRGYLGRVSAGAYAFTGEEPDWHPTHAQLVEAADAGVGAGFHGEEAAPAG